MAVSGFRGVSLLSRVFVIFFLALAEPASAVGAARSEEKASYAPGDAIPVSCLNRTV